MSFLDVLMLKLKLIFFDKLSVVYLVLFVVIGGFGKLNILGVYIVFFVVIGNEMIYAAKVKTFKFVTMAPTSKEKLILADYFIYSVLIAIDLGISYAIHRSLEEIIVGIAIAVVVFVVGITFKYLNFRVFAIYNLVILVASFGIINKNLKAVEFIGQDKILILIIGGILLVAGYILSVNLYKNLHFIKR